MCSQLRSAWKILAISGVATFGLLGPTSGQQPPPVQEIASPLVPPALPPISSGTVTLPYGELKALWEAAQPKAGPPTPAKAPAPPVAFSVQSARYEVTSSDDARQVTGQVVFEIIGFAEGWTAVPLLPAREVLLSGVEPEGTLVAIRDGTYTLFLDHPGRRSVTLRFSADVRILRLVFFCQMLSGLPAASSVFRHPLGIPSHVVCVLHHTFNGPC